MDPFLASVLAGLIPSLLLAALAWHTNRVRKDREKLDEVASKRIDAIDETLRIYGLRGRDLELAMERVQSSVGATTNDTQELREELRDIQANMIRKEDFAEAMKALREHISDVLRLTPHNKRR